MKLRKLIAATVALSAVLVLVPAGMANAIGADNTSCSATAVRATVLGTLLFENTANPERVPCAFDDQTVLVVPVPGLLTAGAAVSRTFGVGIDYARASVADVVVNGIPGVPGILIQGVHATAHANCDLTGGSSVASLSIGVATPMLAVSDPVTIPLGVATIYLNREITGTHDNGNIFVIRRAVEIDVPVLGINIVLGEAYADAKCF